jgi:hypothetical protein
MPKLARVLPEARFVHLTRDGRDAAISRRSRAVAEPAPFGVLAKRWKRRILQARRHSRRVRHYMEARYEDLVTDPEPTLRRICEFSELDFDPAMLRYYERAEERLQEMAGALPAKKGRPEREAGERVAAHAMTTKPPDPQRLQVWKQEMTEAENAEFEEAAGYLLEELGYETATPKSSWLPPEEWARSKTRAERGDGERRGPLSRLFGRA